MRQSSARAGPGTQPQHCPRFRPDGLCSRALRKGRVEIRSLCRPRHEPHPQTAQQHSVQSAESLAPITAQTTEQQDSKLQETQKKGGECVSPSLVEFASKVDFTANQRQIFSEFLGLDR
jgi:hypothetical protein